MKGEYMADENRFFDFLTASVAAGRTLRDATKDIQCSESTAYRLAATVAFKTRVNEIRSEVSASIVGRLVTAGTAAVDCLEGILQDDDAKHSDRIAASKAILAAIGPMSEIAELRARLDAIEASRPEELRVA